MGEEFLLPLVFSSGNVILLKRPDGGMADTRDLKSLGLSVRVRVPLRAPLLRSKKPFEVPSSTIQKAFLYSDGALWLS